MRIKLQHRLHLGGQAIEISAHVRDAAGNIDADIPGRANHDSAAGIRRNAASPRAPGTRNFTPVGNSTSMRLADADAAQYTG